MAAGWRARDLGFGGALACIALLGAAAVLFSARRGLNVTPDAVLYLDAARNLAAGRGLTVSLPDRRFQPMTHFPPGFPAVLAAGGMVGDPLAAARGLQAVVFGLSTALLGVIVLRETGARVAALFGALLFLLSPDLLYVHAALWSEPLFILCALAGFAGLRGYLAQGRRWALYGGGAALALALLLRYAGAGLVAAGTLVLLIFGERPWRSRLRSAGVFLLIAAGPSVLWALMNRSAPGTATVRETAFHPLGIDTLRMGIHTVAHWALPTLTPWPVKAGVVVLALAGALLIVGTWLWRTGIRRKTPHSVHTAMTFYAVIVLGYVAFLAAMISFLDAMIPLDMRLLAPAFPFALILGLIPATAWAQTRWNRRWVRCAVPAAMLLVTAGFAWRAGGWCMRRGEDGAGFTTRAWRESPLMRRIASLPRDTLVASNGLEPILFLTGRTAAPLPERLNPHVRRVNAAYARDLDALGDLLRRRDGRVAWFRTIAFRPYFPTEEDLVAALALTPEFTCEDGALYRSGQTP